MYQIYNVNRGSKNNNKIYLNIHNGMLKRNQSV